MDRGDAPAHRVVIVGGGFGGLLAARRLGNTEVAVTMVDRRNHHLFQPLLYQVATGLLAPGQIAPALRHILRKKKNIAVELADVTDIDIDRRTVHAVIAGFRDVELSYDSLIVAAGATPSYFGHDGFALFAPGMKTIDDAFELRRRFLGAFEMAELAPDDDERAQWLTVVVVGAGPTGVELAGQIRELAVRSLRGEFRNFDPATVRVLLLDTGPAPLSSFGDRLARKAAMDLEQLGVELRMGARVVGIDALGVDVETADGTKSRIEARTTVWAAGVMASPLAAVLARATGAELEGDGRVTVQPDLTLPGHPEVFVIGDMAAIDHLPGVAEVAMQGGLHAANTVLRRMKDQPVKAFRYRDLGSVASIGRFRAVASVKGIHLSGFPGWVVWMFVHLAFLNGFGNRFSTVLKWLRSMVGRGRAERDFSTAHTGGDLSLPDQVKQTVQPNPFPVVEATGWTGEPDDHEVGGNESGGPPTPGRRQ